MAGRQILNQALIVNDAIEDYRSKKKEDKLFKIDFKKAYTMWMGLFGQVHEEERFWL